MSHEASPTLLKKGIAAIKAKNKAQARQFLLKAVEQEPNNEVHWLWLAVAAESLEEKSAYLQQALTLNPNNNQAMALLKQVEAHRAASPSRPPTWSCPLCRAKDSTVNEVCPNCHAVLTLGDLKQLLSNTAVNAELVTKAIKRLQQTPADSMDADTNIYLGIAYFNLKQVRSGAKHLQQALQLRPNDRTLQAQISQLRNQLPPPPRTIPKKKTRGSILIIDDSPTVCKLVSMTLQRKQFEVRDAKDGLEGLVKINEQMPDLILLDINMPQMDGYQLCKIVKSNKSIQHIPIIMLSGKDGFFDKVRGKMAGSTDYITKPFDPKTLMKVVATHIGTKAK